MLGYLPNSLELQPNISQDNIIRERGSRFIIKKLSFKPKYHLGWGCCVLLKQNSWSSVTVLDFTKCPYIQ